MHTKPIPPARVEYGDTHILRPVEPSDVPQIERARMDSDTQLRRFMDWAHHPVDREQLLDRVITQWSNYFKGVEYEMALFDKKTGDFLVYTGFYPSLRINPCCFEIGFWTSCSHTGQGCATLATQIQIALIFEYFKGDRIEVTANLENHASLHIIDKCGFHKEGDLRNFYPVGNEQMFSMGYVRERRVSLFSLIPEDRPHLPWYQPLTQQIILHPLLGSPIPLIH